MPAKYKMMMTKGLFSIALLVTFVAIVPYAQAVDQPDSTTIPNELLVDTEGKLKEWCAQSPAVESKKFFPDTYLNAKSIRQDYCEHRIQSLEILQSRIIDLLSDLKRLFPLSNLQIELQRKELSRIEENRKDVAQFEVRDEPVISIILESDEKRLEITGDRLTECDAAAKEIDSAGNCEAALIEFGHIYNLAVSNVSQPVAIQLAQRLGELEKKWDDFGEKSRSQTLWEMAINSWYFQKGKDNVEHKYLAPPEWQFVIMHPDVVIENVGEAVDGQQLKEAIMIEAIGLNRWEQEEWYIPSGGSLVALYSDRREVQDWGYGVALYFKSNFTLGVSNHSGDMGFFMSIDLLKLIQDKKILIGEYRGDINI